MNQKHLAAALKEWFNTKNLKQKNFWNNNEVAEIIKSHLEKAGRWKNKTRGNSKK